MSLSEPEDELGEATGGEKAYNDTETERKLIEAFRNINSEPEINTPDDASANLKTPDDFRSVMSRFGYLKSGVAHKNVAEEHERDDRFRRLSIDRRDVSEPEPIIMPYSHPKFPSFGGKSGKGEVTWDCFKFEIELLITDRVFSQEHVLHGIRRAAKGEVADIIRRLGTLVTVDQVLNKLESVYGNIETRETIMKKMYNCTQKPNKSDTSFASRSEEYFDKAVLLR